LASIAKKPLFAKSAQHNCAAHHFVPSESPRLANIQASAGRGILLISISLENNAVMGERGNNVCPRHQKTAKICRCRIDVLAKRAI
jgi:hypothetical protein